jgi:hypothetical protein
MGNNTFIVQRGWSDFSSLNIWWKSFLHRDAGNQLGAIRACQPNRGKPEKINVTIATEKEK